MWHDWWIAHRWEPLFWLWLLVGMIVVLAVLWPAIRKALGFLMGWYARSSKQR